MILSLVFLAEGFDSVDKLIDLSFKMLQLSHPDQLSPFDFATQRLEILHLLYRLNQYRLDFGFGML